MKDKHYEEGVLAGIILARLEATISSLKARGILSDSDLRKHGRLTNYRMQRIIAYLEKSSADIEATHTGSLALRQGDAK